MNRVPKHLECQKLCAFMCLKVSAAYATASSPTIMAEYGPNTSFVLKAIEQTLYEERPVPERMSEKARLGLLTNTALSWPK